MFVGRYNEIDSLSKAFEEPHMHCIVYGNRRVGKTQLVIEAAKRSDVAFINYECTKSTLKSNLDRISTQLYEQKLIPSMLSFPTFTDFFVYLNSTNKRFIVLIDEYPYLYYKNDKNEVDSEFQTILDKYCSNINVVISGSHIGMMKNLLKQKNPLFGRMDTIIHLQELNYLEASEFYPNFSNYDKVSFYAVFGGSPFILKQLNPQKSLKENICKTFLNLTSSVYLYISEGYTTDLTAKDSADQIFEVIGNSKKRHNRIEELLGYEHNGLLSKQLNLLSDMEFIGKNAPINKISDSKKATYYIKSNAMRFYFTYVYGKQNILSMIGPEAFYEQFIKESLVTFLSLRFEDVVRDYISLQVKKNKIKGVFNIGSYYYDDATNKKNGEFDVAVERKDGFDIIEVKFLKDKVDKSIIKQEISQINEIRGINVSKIGFASINGFKEDVGHLDYKISGDDIFSVE